MKKLFIFFITLFLFSQSCTSIRKNVTPDTSRVSFKMLMEHNSAWRHSIRSMSGDMRITLDTPQYSGNFNASILVNEPDSMLVTVTGPFGMHLGKVFVAQNRFIFYNQVMNQFMKGAQEDFEGRNFLQFPLEIGQLKNVFSASDPFDVLHKETYIVRDNKYFLKAANGRYQYQIWFDPALLLISRIEYILDNKITFVKEYENYRKINGIYFPHLINFVRPDEKQGFSIIMTDLEINQKVDQNLYKIKVSDSATQIDLGL